MSFAFVVGVSGGGGAPLGRARENNLATVLFAVAGAYFGFAVVARPPAI